MIIRVDGVHSLLSFIVFIVCNKRRCIMGESVLVHVCLLATNLQGNDSFNVKTGPVAIVLTQ